MNVGKVCAEIAGGENIRGENSLVVGHFFRQLEQADISKGNASVLGLQSIEWPRIFGAAKKCGAGELAIWIGIIALRVVARSAVRASSAGNCGRNDGAISGLYIADGFADFFNDADAFMTEDSAFLHTGHGATHEMQICAANSAGGQTHNGVEVVLYRRLLDRVQSNISNPMENDGFHSFSPEKSFVDFLVLITHYRDSRLLLTTLSPCL